MKIAVDFPLFTYTNLPFAIAVPFPNYAGAGTEITITKYNYVAGQANVLRPFQNLYQQLIEII
ncbi:hypothetical protein ACA106_07205 [Agrobacterium pusense]|uniref:hypothetical protein n=1 Tax=Agrobacterium pusense TaxID=648995 RepID=UPI0035A7365A